MINYEGESRTEARLTQCDKEFIVVAFIEVLDEVAENGHFREDLVHLRCSDKL